jgi:translation initiation factor IF-2
MDKVRISEIAQELGLTSKEVLTYAHEIDIKAKAANSSVSVEEAEVLMEYIMSGKKPATQIEKTKKVSSTESKSDKNDNSEKSEVTKNESKVEDKKVKPQKSSSKKSESKKKSDNKEKIKIKEKKKK